MDKHLRFQAGSCTNIEQQIILYFTQSGFKLLEQTNNSLNFKRGSSILDSWKFNPLKWGSEIIVSFNGQEIEAKFTIDTTAKIVTKEVKEVWNVFIENLKQYVVHGIPFDKANSEAIERARQSILKTLAWTILAIVIGGIMGGFISHLTGWTIMGYIGIFLGAYLVLKNKQMEEGADNAL